MRIWIFLCKVLRSYQDLFNQKKNFCLHKKTISYDCINEKEVKAIDNIKILNNRMSTVIRGRFNIKGSTYGNRKF